MSPELARAAGVAARAFRLGMSGQGSDELTRVLDLLLASVRTDARAGARLAPLVGAWSEAQRRGDWLALADALEHELPRVLG